MTADQDKVRAAVRVTAEQLAPGDRIVPWNDRDAGRRTVAATYASEHGTVLIEWDDHTVTRHHRWSVWHAKNRRPNLHHQ